MGERKRRREAAEYGRELWERRLVTGSSGNLSFRLDEDRVLCTPSGVSLRNLNPGDLVVTDLQGTAHDTRSRPTSELPLHLCAYRARPDVRAVIHSHPTFCVIWSKFGAVFARDTVGARETLRDVAFTPFRRAGSAALAELCAGAFASGIDNVLMEAHGLSCIARTFEDAFVQTDLCEEAARIAWYSRVANQEAPA